jgi:hypothetical protein
MKGRSWPTVRGEGAGVTFLRDHVNYDGPDCLIWPLSRHPTGYGSFGYLGEVLYAHRFMCELANGPPPDPVYEAAHSCGRGRDGCVHPKHLSWKTRTQNALDSRGHGTQVRNRWSNRGKITRRQVAEIWAAKGIETQTALAKKYDVSGSTIRDIYLGRSHLGMTAVAMLRLLSERDLGDFSNFSSGMWSRRSLEAMIDDLVADTNADPTSGQLTGDTK